MIVMPFYDSLTHVTNLNHDMNFEKSHPRCCFLSGQLEQHTPIKINKVFLFVPRQLAVELGIGDLTSTSAMV